MNKETLEALKGSIKKWEKIVDRTGTNLGTENCPLYELFFWNFDCKNCPVESYCCNYTPYEDWCDHADYKHYGDASQIHCSECEDIA